MNTITSSENPVVNVVIRNLFVEVVEEYFIEVNRNLIDELHTHLSKKHPECFVNFSYDEKQSFICGMPYAMQIDEKLVDDGLLSFDSYYSRWYPKCN